MSRLWNALLRLDRRFSGPVATRVRVVTGLLIGLYAIAAVAAPHAVLPAVLTADSTGSDSTWTTPPDPGDVPASAVVAPPAAAGAASSAITAEAKGEFAGLKVSVSQTSNLINQVVKVRWTGGKPTVGNATDFQFDYLQIMECWGDDPRGPDRTQCQFGAYKDDNGGESRGGEWVPSRKILKQGEGYVDTNEKADFVAGLQNGQLPFYSALGTIAENPVPGFFSDFDRYTTNEVVLSATAGDGTGEEDFEVQTYQEAPGLGCGKARSASDSTIRNCWLVVVPRGETEVDGSTMDQITKDTYKHKLNTSPLSASNWAHRIVFPLQFQPVGQACPIGKKQTPLLGVETASEVVLRWQPTLCANDGPVFGWSSVAGSVATNRLAKDDPAMVLINSAVPGDVPDDRTYVYAPVAISGITVSALIQRVPAAGAPPEETKLAGKPITEINLTPRVVAKVLTQSYRFNALKGADYLSYPDGKPYPDNVTRDPDFLQDNPQFDPAKESIVSTLDILLPLTTSTSNRLLWEWIAADQKATDFLAGQPDEYGMRVNPFYQGMAVPTDTFPKIDPYCDYPSNGAAPMCTFDAHPYAQDFHEVARSVGRGDSLARTVWDQFAQPPAYKKIPPALNGVRHLLGVTDTASAARYGLVTAKLKNASGAFVAPTSESLLAGVAGMRKSAVDGVVLDDPTTTKADAYPLATVTYAVTAPNKLTEEQATNYGRFLRLAAGSGQTPGTAAGTLPDGYAPLTAAMKAQTLAAAADVEARVGPPAASSPDTTGATDAADTADDTSTGATAATTGSTAGNTAATSANANSSAGSGPTTGAASAVDPGTSAASPAAPGGSSPAASPPAGNTTPVAYTSAPSGATSDRTTQRLTPTELVGWSRYVLVIALLLGSAAALLGPALPRLVWRLDQRGATPTSTTAPPHEAPEKTGEGTRRASDDAMATSA